jgi:hypothetical protein
MADTYPEKHNKTKQTNKQSSDKENNEGCLPQALSFKSSARLSSGDNSYSE